ncbi:hypothetical protein [Escherichia coli]|uniref:hypothetical protein n=1 Tax=Escherichia coli TaxID=562 RepID=UPI003C2E4C97
MNKALLPLLLCCFIFPASGKDAGWQWYNEKINPKEKENKPVPAYSALFDHGLASKSDQRFASIRSTGNLTFSTAF